MAGHLFVDCIPYSSRVVGEDVAELRCMHWQRISSVDSPANAMEISVADVEVAE